MPLKALAGRLGLTKASLSRIENGKQSMTPRVARKLSEETGIAIRDLCPELAEMFPEAAG